jgi:hypothetical protein
MEIDHGWCTSIYATDPNGIMVEFCTSTRAFTEDEREAALRILADPNPELDPDPPMQVYRASEHRS